jgi:hypothetical protein
MIAILCIVALYLVIQFLLLVLAAVIGIGLHWCFPDLNIGHGILVGMISSVVSVYFLVQLMKVVQMGTWQDESLDDDDDEDDEDDEEEDDDELPSDTLPDVRMARPLTPKERRQRRGDRR